MCALIARIEPTSLGPDEDAYRRHFLAVDRSREMASMTLVLVLSVLVFGLEMTYLDAAQLAPIAIVRVLFFAFSAVMYAATRGEVTPASLDRASLLWWLMFSAQLVALMALRPASRADDVGMMLLVLAIYALSPAPLLLRITPAALLTIGYTVVLMSSHAKCR